MQTSLQTISRTPYSPRAFTADSTPIPAIFELEMDRIFGHAWLYVGHESQVRNPGDYFLTQVGRKAMVVDARRNRQAAGAAQSVRPSRRDGGGVAIADTPRNSSASITAGPITSMAG